MAPGRGTAPKGNSILRRRLADVNAAAIVVPSLLIWLLSFDLWPWEHSGLVVGPLLLVGIPALLVLLVEWLSEIGAYVVHPVLSILGDVLCPTIFWCLGPMTRKGEVLGFMYDSPIEQVLFGVPLTVAIGSVGFLLPGLIAGLARSVRRGPPRERKVPPTP